MAANERQPGLRVKRDGQETAAHDDVDETEYVGFRSTAAGREIVALLCRRWTGEPLSKHSTRFGLMHPDSTSNPVRRAKSRQERSKEYRQAVEDIEHDLDLKTENPVCPPRRASRKRDLDVRGM